MCEITIVPYKTEYWEDICAIHDAARKIELKLAALDAAFLPLEIVAEREGLFDYPHVEVALEDGRPVAFCAYTDEELAWLYVAPEHMRRGIGRKMALHALDTEKGICYIEALKGNEPARKLYESLGFAVTEILSGRMPGNEEFQVQAYAMRRAVPGRY